jgi:photosystem II stability/assembly factor-like uncharacterized protein
MNSRRAIRELLLQALLCCGLVAFQADVSNAQWTQTNGPKGGSIRSLAVVPDGAGGTHVFAGQQFVWRTGDAGASWTRFTNGLTDHNAFALLAVPRASGGHDLFVGTNGGIFRSGDQGANWTGVNNGITNPSIYALGSGPNGSGGTNLYAGAFLGDAFRSSDNGASWTSIGSGLPVGQANINAFVTTASGTVLAATMNGIYRSTNFGASWTRVFTLFGFAFAQHGGTLYAGTSDGVYRSTNDGVSWTPINTGMKFAWTRAVAVVPNGSGVTLFAGAGYVLRSTDNGASWTMVNTGLPTPFVWSLATAPNASGGTDLYAGTGEGVFRTSDLGATWTNASFTYSQVYALEVTPAGRILAATENDVFRSDDGGGTWIDTGSQTTILDFAVNPHGTGGTTVFAGGSPSGIFKSTDGGASWFGSSNLLDDFDVNSMGAIPNGTGGTNLLAGTYSKLFISTNDGGGWRDGNLETLTLDYLATPNGSGGHNVFAGGFGGVWLSTDYGASWTPVNAGLTDKGVQAMAATADGANLFAAGPPFGVYRSTNNGATWTPVNNGLTDLGVMSLLSPDGTNLFAAIGGGVALSTNNGDSWTSVGTGLPGGVHSLALSADGSTLLAGSAGFGVWKRPLSEMIDVEPPPPPSPPSIASFTPASGTAGAEVTITGSNFSGASAVSFNLTPSIYNVVSAGEIRAIVPSGASTGRIRVTTLAGTATSATDFTVTSPPPPTTLTFTPPHDAYVRSSSPSSNFGSAGELRVRSSGPTMRSYLKFNVTGVTGAVQSATLRLRVQDGGSNGGSVFKVSNNFAGSSNPWTESGLRWTNAPPIGGGALDAAGSVSAGTWVELDVTSAVTGNGTVSFAVSGGSSNTVDYSSSEGGNPPQLVVVASGSAAETPGETLRSAEMAPKGIVTLGLNYPNPFQGGTTIQYSLPVRTSARLVIYDVSGRAVRTLVDGEQAAGAQRATWDGRDAHGSRVGPGVYIYRLEAGGTSLTRRMSLLK